MNCRKCNVELVQDAVFCHLCGTRQDPVRAKRRRSNGEGTVYKRGKSWCCEKTFGFVMDADGKVKRIYASKYGFKTRAEATAYVQLLQDPRIKKSTKGRSPTITLKALYDLWLPTHKASKNTLNCYIAGFKAFEPVWYSRMVDMDIDDLQECLDEYIPKKGSDGRRTRENAKTCLGLIYKYGIPRGYIPPNLAGESNLAKFLRIKPGIVTDKSGISMEELERIRQAVGFVPFADYIYANCYLGFRPSAFLDLDVQDYNRKEQAICGGIKTDAGINRTVTVSPKIAPIIERLAKDKISGPIFCGNGGKKLSIAEYRSNFYKALDTIGIDNPVDEYGVHRITPHSCRHTFATLLKAVKAPDKDKLELIGHTSEEMLRYYQDVSLADLRKITDLI